MSIESSYGAQPRRHAVNKCMSEQWAAWVGQWAEIPAIQEHTGRDQCPEIKSDARGRALGRAWLGGQLLRSLLRPL